MPKKFKKVVVLLGGRSAERDVSLKSGQAVLKALVRKGYDAKAVDARGLFWNELKDENTDAVFVILHGRYGEDGTVQGMLELMDIPYTGSGVTASALAMDKILTKAVLRQYGVPVADDFEFGQTIRYPVIVKPSREGSTIGVTIVSGEEELAAAYEEAARYDDRVLIEEFVEGQLLTVAVIGTPATALPIVEVRAKSGFYDYEAKYTPGQTEYIVPAVLAEDKTSQLQQAALDAHNALGCDDLSRVDFIMEPGGRIVCLEVNTLPGLTETSLVPKAAAAAGLGFEELVEKVLTGAALKQKPKPAAKV